MTDSIRDLGFISWHDPYAAMEDVSGNSIQHAIKQQTEIYKYAYANVNKKDKEKWIKLYKSQPKKDTSYYNFRWAGHTIHVGHYNRANPKLKIELMNGSVRFIKTVGGFGITPTRLWAIQDMSDGREQLDLVFYSKSIKEVQKINNVGDSAVNVGETVYYITSENTFWYNKIYVMRGDESTLLYEEKTEKYVLSLVKPKNQNDVFIVRKSAIFHDIGLIEKSGKITWLKKGMGTKVPLTKDIMALNTHLEINGRQISYPDNRFIVDAHVSGSDIFAILCKDVSDALYKYSRGQWTLLYKAVGDIVFCSYSDDIMLGRPNAPDRILRIVKETTAVVIKEMAGPTFGLISDINPLPWFAIMPEKKPTSLLICGYGSYGKRMRRSQVSQWIPWLKQNYMVVNICVRGGGENGDAWWNASRGPQNRKYGVRDFAVGVKYIQSRFGFDKSNTVIYGRSAGGFLVTAALEYLLQHVAVVFAEKPYTDVLRTVTNWQALQCPQESDEFGYISSSAVDFAEIMKISPYENIKPHPPRNPAVILTAGINDPEVPMAMPIRYATKAQNMGWRNVVCRIENEGHFVKNTDGNAQDAALCEYYIKASQHKSESLLNANTV
jgi:protease II